MIITIFGFIMCFLGGYYLGDKLNLKDTTITMFLLIIGTFLIAADKEV